MLGTQEDARSRSVMEEQVTLRIPAAILVPSASASAACAGSRGQG